MVAVQTPLELAQSTHATPRLTESGPTPPGPLTLAYRPTATQLVADAHEIADRSESDARVPSLGSGGSVAIQTPEEYVSMRA